MKRWMMMSVMVAFIGSGAVMFLGSAKAEGTCSGDKSCSACKNCRYCKHCVKEGGTCGVCK